MVYCRMGLITSTRAGKTPAKSAFGPSSCRRALRVASVLGFLLLLLRVGCVAGGGSDDDGPFSPPPPVLLAFEEGEDEEGADSRAVIRVLTTQIGFVISTVAEPAIAPAIIDSTVVSFMLVREGDRAAARSKKARVHSYPVFHASLISAEVGCITPHNRSSRSDLGTADGRDGCNMWKG